MPEITSIEQQVKDKNRSSIFIDGRFYCGIKTQVAVKLNLKVGMHVDEADLDRIQLETEKSQALDRVLNYLSAMKTKKQITDYMQKCGYTQAVADYVMERLEYYGFVDDVAYCKAYASSVSGKSKRAMAMKLMQRGADPAAIKTALEDVSDDKDEVLAILKKYMRGKTVNKQNMYKALRYLISKGFSYDVAKGAHDRFLSEDGQEDCDDGDEIF